MWSSMRTLWGVVLFPTQGRGIGEHPDPFRTRL